MYGPTQKQYTGTGGSYGGGSSSTSTPSTPSSDPYSTYVPPSSGGAGTPDVISYGGTYSGETAPSGYTPTYFQLFGTPSPEDMQAFYTVYYSITGEDIESHPAAQVTNYVRPFVVDYSSGASTEQINKIKEQEKEFLETGMLPYDLTAQLDSLRESIPTQTIADKVNEGAEYKTPTSLREAKGLADKIYVDTLEHHLTLHAVGSDEHEAIRQALILGPLNFNNPEAAINNLFGDMSTYAVQEAARFQAASMKEYLTANNIPLYQEVENEAIEGDKVYLNTGTALQWFEEDGNALNLNGGHFGYNRYLASEDTELGSYSMYETAPPPPENNAIKPLTQLFAVGSVILSGMFPQFGPIFSAVNTLVQGGNLEDALKNGASQFIASGISNATTAELNEVTTKIFDAGGIDLTSMPVPAQNMILDTSRSMMLGESGSDAFKASATGELLESIDVDIDSPDFNFDTPEFISNFGNVLKDAGEAVVDVLEEPVDLIADAFEPVLDFGDDVIDAVEPIVQTGSDVLSDAEDVVIDAVEEETVDASLPEPVQNVVNDTVQALLEGGSATDAALESIASESWSAIKDAAPALEDAIKDVIPDVDFNTPEWLENAGNIVVELAETVEPIAKTLEDVFIDPIDDAVDAFGGNVVDPILQAGQQVTEAIIDPIDDAIDAFGDTVVDPVLQTGQQVTEAIIDPIDDVIDAFGDTVVDPILQAGSDVLSDVEDVLKEGGRFLDDLIDWDKLVGLRAAGVSKPLTPTETLFAGEIYQHKIKEAPDMLFTNEQIKNYLKGNNTQQATNVSVPLDMFGQPSSNVFGSKGGGLFGKGTNEFLGTAPVVNNKPNKEDEEVKPFDLFSSTI